MEILSTWWSLPAYDISTFTFVLDLWETKVAQTYIHSLMAFCKTLRLQRRLTRCLHSLGETWLQSSANIWHDTFQFPCGIHPLADFGLQAARFCLQFPHYGLCLALLIVHEKCCLIILYFEGLPQSLNQLKIVLQILQVWAIRLGFPVTWGRKDSRSIFSLHWKPEMSWMQTSNCLISSNAGLNKGPFKYYPSLFYNTLTWTTNVAVYKLRPLYILPGSEAPLGFISVVLQVLSISSSSKVCSSSSTRLTSSSPLKSEPGASCLLMTSPMAVLSILYRSSALSLHPQLQNPKSSMN